MIEITKNTEINNAYNNDIFTITTKKKISEIMRINRKKKKKAKRIKQTDINDFIVFSNVLFSALIIKTNND